MSVVQTTEAVAADAVAAAAAGVPTGQVMTRSVATVRPDDSVLAAWELLSRGRFHHLPVVTSDGRVVSLVDDRNVAEALITPLVRRRRLVADIMAPRVHCVLATTPLGRVAHIMVTESATAVPVVDERMRLLGLVTTTDIVRLIAGTAELHERYADRALAT